QQKNPCPEQRREKETLIGKVGFSVLVALPDLCGGTKPDEKIHLANGGEAWKSGPGLVKEEKD
ncbi:hypothetical protein P7K49_024643, partial [Saguinus oedipus]